MLIVNIHRCLLVLQNILVFEYHVTKCLNKMLVVLVGQ